MTDAFSMLLGLHSTIKIIKMQKSSNIKPFIDLYNWKGIAYPTSINE